MKVMKCNLAKSLPAFKHGHILGYGNNHVNDRALCMELTTLAEQQDGISQPSSYPNWRWKNKRLVKEDQVDICKNLIPVCQGLWSRREIDVNTQTAAETLESWEEAENSGCVSTLRLCRL